MKMIFGKFHIKNLRVFITLIVAGIVAVSLLMSALFFSFSNEEILTERYQTDIKNQLNQINTRVNEQVKLTDSIFPLLMSNTIIQNNLDPAAPAYIYKTAVAKRPEIEQQMSYTLIGTYLWDKNLIQSAYIFDSKDHVFSVSLHEFERLTEQDIQNMRTSGHLTNPNLGIYIREDMDRSIYFFRNVFSVFSGELIATVILDIDRTKWENLCFKDMSENWVFLLYNRDMQLLQSKNSAIFTETEIQEIFRRPIRSGSNFATIRIGSEEFFVASQNIAYTHIASVAIAPVSDLYDVVNSIMNRYMQFCIILICMTIIFALLSSFLITRPVTQMINHVRKISTKEAKNIPKGLYTQFNELADSFNALLKQLDNYYADNYKQRILLKNAEINALQAQIAPHFLFNVLDTIAWKTQSNDNGDAYKMIVALGELLRASVLSKDGDLVPLTKELSYINYYIYLQKMRFEDKFHVALDIPENPDQYRIPRLCIQPLIENAVQHGLEPLSENGQLNLSVSADGVWLKIKVDDNGVGFPDDFNFNTLSPSAEDVHTHIGLNNLNKRLLILYGAESALNISRKADGWTVVEFKLPLVPGAPAKIEERENSEVEDANQTFDR